MNGIGIFWFAKCATFVYMSGHTIYIVYQGQLKTEIRNVLQKGTTTGSIYIYHPAYLLLNVLFLNYA